MLPDQRLPFTAAEVIAILVALAALLNSIISARKAGSETAKTRAETAKAKAETTEAEADAEIKLLPLYKHEVSELRARIETQETINADMAKRLLVMESEQAEYRLGVQVLINQLRRLGVEPQWKPHDYIG